MAPREPRIGDIAEIANAIQLAAVVPGRGLGRTVFFVGAGCSISAGIPSVPSMAQLLVVKLATAKKAPADVLRSAEDAYNWLSPTRGIPDCRIGETPRDGVLDSRAVDWFRVYDVLFSDHYKTPDHAREIFSDFVDRAEGKINWAHLCLGELVKQNLVSTVVTTNFDQLVLAGLVRSGVLPVVCDGIESLTRIRGAPLHAQLIELHGSRHTYRLRNAPHELAELSNSTPTIAAIETLFQELRVLVVVGYGGREKGVMDLLIKAAERFTDKQLFWVLHKKDPTALSDNARHLLSTSRNSAILIDQDADLFSLRLLRELRIGAPEAIREPLFLARLHASQIAIPSVNESSDSSVIAAEISRHRDEIEAMGIALGRHRDARSGAEAALVKAREFRLAGNVVDAMKLLQAAAAASDDTVIWRELAEVADELGANSSNREPHEIAVGAWRRVLELTDQA